MGVNFSSKRKNKLGVPVSKQAARLYQTWETTNSDEDLERLINLHRKHELSWNQLGLGQKRELILAAKKSMESAQSKKVDEKSLKEPVRRPCSARMVH